MCLEIRVKIDLEPWFPGLVQTTKESHNSLSEGQQLSLKTSEHDARNIRYLN
jgi:hypothetical protein